MKMKLLQNSNSYIVIKTPFHEVGYILLSVETNIKSDHNNSNIITTWDDIETGDSLWPSDCILQHKTGSTLVQVMACCLMAPSHYLNQC